MQCIIQVVFAINIIHTVNVKCILYNKHSVNICIIIFQYIHTILLNTMNINKDLVNILIYCITLYYKICRYKNSRTSTEY